MLPAIPIKGQLPEKSIKNPPVQLFLQAGGKICTCLAFMSNFKIKGRICCKLQRISPENVISSKFIKSFRFKGKTVNKSYELLPNWPFLGIFSCLLDFKGIILTTPKEL